VTKKWGTKRIQKKTLEEGREDRWGLKGQGKKKFRFAVWRWEEKKARIVVKKSEGPKVRKGSLLKNGSFTDGRGNFLGNGNVTNRTLRKSNLDLSGGGG